MKMNFKKTLSLILAVLMVMTAVPLSGMATGTEPCEHNYKYTNIEEGTHSYFCLKCKTGDYADCTGGTPTCGAKKTCEFCDTPYGETLPHNFEKREEKADALYQEGTNCKVPNKYYESCTVCGTPSNKAEDIFSSTTKFGPHDYDDGTVSDVTCTVDGVRTYKCQIYGCTEVKTETEAALGHLFTEKLQDDAHLANAGDCKTNKTYYYDCARCDFNAKDLAEGKENYIYEGDAKGDHDLRNLKDSDFLKSESTCSEPAKYYRWCSVCERTTFGLYGKDGETFDAGEPHAKPTTAAEVRECTPEEESKHLRKKANCMNNATYYYLCKECGERVAEGYADATSAIIHFYEKQDTALNPLHNKFSDATLMKKVSTGKDATCTTAAVPDKYECCANNPDCKGKTFEDYSPYNANLKVKEVNGIKEFETDENGNKISLPLGHEITKTVEYKAPKCAVEGNYASEYCKGCNTSFYYESDGKTSAGEATGDKLKTIKATGHKNTDGNDSCDICGAVLKPSDTCSCVCHKTSGIMYFVALILKFFWKLSGSNEYCKCTKGDFVVKHY